MQIGIGPFIPAAAIAIAVMGITVTAMIISGDTRESFLGLLGLLLAWMAIPEIKITSTDVHPKKAEKEIG